MFGADLVSRFELGGRQLIDLGDQWQVFGRRFPGPDRFTGITHEFVDGVDGDVALLMAKHHGAEHDFFRQLLRFGLDHQHSGLGTGHHQVHLGVFELGLAGVEHVLAVDVGHAGGTDRAVERNAGNRQRSARSDQRRNIAFDFRVERQHMNHNLNFIEEAFWKQGADRAVDQARSQGFELTGAAFALEKAAGDAAGGVAFLQVVHCQGEEILAGLGVGLGDHGGQHHSAVHVDDDSAAGLAGDFAGFHRDLVLAPLEGFADFIKHAHCVCSIESGRIRLLPNARSGPAEHDAIPQNASKPPGGGVVRRLTLWNDTARALFALLRSKKRLS